MDFSAGFDTFASNKLQSNSLVFMGAKEMSTMTVVCLIIKAIHLSLYGGWSIKTNSENNKSKKSKEVQRENSVRVCYSPLRASDMHLSHRINNSLHT